MDLISKHTRIAFRDYLVDWTLRTISDLFDAVDIPRGEPKVTFSGARRSLVEEYYAGVDWSSPADIRKVLRAYEEVLNHIQDEVAYAMDSRKQYLEKQLQKLTNVLKRDRFTYENRRLVPTTEMDLQSIPDASAIVDQATLRDHIRRIEQNIDPDPAQAIGSSKELVETVAKLVLTHYGQDPDRHDTLQQLVKQALKCLNLSLEDIPEVKKGAEAIRQVFSALGQIVGATAELRNLYGTGHGRTRVGGLQPRHVRLVVGAAAALSRFLLETLDARKKVPPS